MAPPELDDPVIGRTIGPYTIVAEIGRGAMGVVYRAVHGELHEHRAVKLLAPDAFASQTARQRLREEARALVRVQHPNVAILHDYITTPECDCIVMELVSGASLDEVIAERGALPPAEVVKIGIQLAEGLAAAHAEGVIHRDLKPGNLRMTAQGRLKILDFGLARRLEVDSGTVTKTDTLTSILVGTPRYIAPEVWKGGKATALSDLYAAGVVLYELATGSPPFPDLQGGAMFHAATNLDPPPPRKRNPAIPVALEAIILRCMERDPSRRFASAQELADALTALAEGRATGLRRPLLRKRWQRIAANIGVVMAAILAAVQIDSHVRDWERRTLGCAPAHPPVRKLLVLPFRNLSPDSSLNYLAYGVTNDLTTELAEYPDLDLPSFNTEWQYVGTRTPITAIARELRRDGIMEGTLQPVGGRVRISVRLFDAQERQLWHRKLTVDRAEILSLSPHLARDIAVRIGVAAAPVDGRSPVDRVAKDLYTQGRYEWNQRSERGIRRAIRLFERAIARDSTYAAAWSGLADAWSAAVFSGLERPNDGYPHAKRAAEHALALDPGLSDAYVSLGNILQNFDWNWPAADSAYRRAIALDPNNEIAHHWYANHCALLGDFDTAIMEIARARALNPLSLPIALGDGAFRYYARRYDAALAAYANAIEIDSTSTVLQRALAADYLALGREADATRAIERWLEVQYPGTGMAGQVRAAYRAHGFPGVLRVLIAGLEAKRRSGRYEPATHVGELYALLGDREAALRWLEIAMSERDPELNRLKVDRIFDPLRGDPRFERLVRAVGFDRDKRGSRG